MPETREKRTITPADKEFTTPINEIFRILEKQLAAHDVTSKLFKGLKEQWQSQGNARTRKESADELAKNTHDPDQVVSKAANRIREVLEEICPYRNIWMTLLRSR